ncbi:tRNA pseudouridine(38-40) synthase TruA [Maribacter hydrothermalis]|uniref:tRNA pseudouridine synthase A n=1 Tax=Maribacter hydrothermalis TaxID=1836467 RepID=A0A1B7Z174_9FLAO|nr:tRNA pseudouridine(38-40) synthase TruA [Maribacter hydrothermalis]APQ18126.1 tRNA pseudouridine(38-40) synthase TruA [Maribacter hydrothermalis]OBR36472.1 tRNA pseudouridine(38,39,40) synthase TruA [Maribacter hydrothermalis]
MNFFIQFSYFGKSYHGWQNQPNAITIQEVLENAMSTLLNNPISLMGAGRTDTGVHAKEMYAHFEIETFENIPEFVFKLNSFLPNDIAVERIFEVNVDAHARFHATARTYEYHISRKKDPFSIDNAYFVKKDLDVEQMNIAAKLLLGKRDFECFSKSNTDVFTNICDLKEAYWIEKNDMLIFTITADRFLRNMVRAIVGTLINVGLGKYSADYVNTILKSKDRTKAGVSVPAKGLYLTSIVYPNTILKNG